MVDWILDTDRSLNADPVYGGLIANTSLVTIPVGVAPVAVSQWNGVTPPPPQAAKNCIPNFTTNQITVNRDGVVSFHCHLSWFGTANATYIFDLYKNGAPTGSRADDSSQAIAGPYNTTTFNSLLSVLIGDVFTLMVSSATGITLTVGDGELIATRQATGLEL